MILFLLQIIVRNIELVEYVIHLFINILSQENGGYNPGNKKMEKNGDFDVEKMKKIAFCMMKRT